MKTNPKLLKRTMTKPLTDPAEFLTQLVNSKGRSDLDGIIMKEVTVIAEIGKNYGYEVNDFAIEQTMDGLLSRHETEYNRLLVQLRANMVDLTHYMIFNNRSTPILLQVFLENGELSVSVTLPEVNVADFDEEFILYQSLAKELADFSGRNSTTIRFNIGLATLFWEDLVITGQVQEVDVGY